MIFTETPLGGAYVIDLHLLSDERGFFARTRCRREFEAHGLNPQVAQCNVSMTRKRATLRGMHYQAAPRPEAKLVRCTAGAVHDVIVDLRSDSRTFKRWFAVELTARNHRMLYIPEGLAHGFLTLTDDVEMTYEMSEFYAPELARGVRWNDPAFGIEWPLEVLAISERDRSHPDFQA
jgi:dTDP-4-dehydrorhamnose 3,5-epimerase